MTPSNGSDGGSTNPGDPTEKPTQKPTEAPTEPSVTPDECPLKEGVAYRGEIILPDGSLYLLGEEANQTWYIKTTQNKDEAVELYVEKVSGIDGAYRLYFMKYGVKTYIDAFEYQSGKGSLSLTTSPDNYYVFDAHFGILKYVKDSSNSYYLGTYTNSSGVTYDTVSCSNMSHITGSNESNVGVSQFPLYLIPIEEVDIPDEPDPTEPEPTEPEPTEPEPDSVNLNVVISEYAASNGWTIGTQYSDIVLDDVITMTIAGGDNSGKFYDGDHIRVYATDTPAGTVTFTAADGYKIVTVKIITVEGTYAFLQINGNSAEDLSNVLVAVNADTVTFNTVKNGSSGKQVRITGIEITYEKASSTPDPIDPEPTEPEPTEPEPIEPAEDEYYLAGSFNNWDTEALLMTKSEDGSSWSIICTFSSNVEFMLYNPATDEWVGQNGNNITCGAGKYAITYNVQNGTVTVTCKHGKIQIISGKDSTCTDAGNTAGLKCSHCGYVINEPIIIPAKGHNYEAYSEDKEPTCTEDGSISGIKCTRCDDIKVAAQVIPAIGHDWNESYVNTDTSSHWQSCNNGCGMKRNEGAHNFVLGSDECTVCGFSCHHTGGTATCANKAICDICHNPYGETLPHTLTHHDAKAPDCTNIGWEAYDDCSECDYTTYREIDALGHTEVAIGEYVAPTCTETGMTAGVKCSVCDTVIEAQQTIDALGHKNVTKTDEKAATCAEEGHEAYYTCGVCNCLFSDEACTNKISAPVVISKSEHTYTSDCDAICNVCNEERPTQVPHTYDSCEDAECNVCGTLREAGACVDTDENGICDVCGSKYVAKATIDFTTQGYTNAQAIASADIGSIAKVTFSNGKYYDSGTAIRAYSGSAITITAVDGYVITGINIVNKPDKTSNTLTSNCGAWDGDSWTGSSNTVTFTVGGSSGHAKIQSITVHCEKADDVPDTPATYDMQIEVIGSSNKLPLTKSEDGASWSIEMTFENSVEFKIYNAATETYVDENATSCEAGKFVITYTVSTGAITVEKVNTPNPEPGKVSGTLSFASKDNRTTFTTQTQVWEQNGITFTNDKGDSTSNIADYASPVRCYAKSTITLEAKGMTTVVFNCNSTTYANALGKSKVAGAEEVSVNVKVVTITFSAAVDSFTITLDAQVRIDSIDVNL